MSVFNTYMFAKPLPNHTVKPYMSAACDIGSVSINNVLSQNSLKRVFYECNCGWVCLSRAHCFLLVLRNLRLRLVFFSSFFRSNMKRCSKPSLKFLQRSDLWQGVKYQNWDTSSENNWNISWGARARCHRRHIPMACMDISMLEYRYVYLPEAVKYWYAKDWKIKIRGKINSIFLVIDIFSGKRYTRLYKYMYI